MDNVSVLNRVWVSRVALGGGGLVFVRMRVNPGSCSVKFD